MRRRHGGQGDRRRVKAPCEELGVLGRGRGPAGLAGRLALGPEETRKSLLATPTLGRGHLPRAPLLHHGLTGTPPPSSDWLAGQGHSCHPSVSPGALWGWSGLYPCPHHLRAVYMSQSFSSLSGGCGPCRVWTN